MRTSQLLILGNGFDLHCGLKSSYADFFRSTILDTIAERFDIQQMKADVSGFWESLLFEYYKKSGKDNYDWCDIETIIKDALLYIVTRINDFVVYASRNIECDNVQINTIENMKNPIKNFLCNNCVAICCSLLRMKTYSSDKVCSLLLDHLVLELHMFERRFCKYLKNNIVNPDNEQELNKSYIIQAMNLLSILTGFSDTQYESMDDIIETNAEEYFEQTSPSMYQSAWRDVHTLSKEFDKLHSVSILSFNYTSLFDILRVESPCLYNNVHGKLCMNACANHCASCNIILGIDDTVIQSQDNDPGLYKFSKTYRKMLTSNVGTPVLPSKDNQLIEIKFYGHSLNEADYSYFQSIFDYYNLYENNNVRLIFYYSKGFDQTEKVYQLINTYGKTLSNKDQGKNLTHKLLLENRLKIVEIA